VVRARLSRLWVIAVVFLLAPLLWQGANVLSTALYYARVESFDAAWRNANVGINRSELGWMFGVISSSAAAISVAAIAWRRAIRWLVVVLLLMWLCELGYSAPHAWHRQLERDTPEGVFIQVAGLSLAIRAVYIYGRGLWDRLRVRKRLSAA
jgi:hypothetical protein